MTVSLDVIMQFIQQFIWPLCRIGAMIMTMVAIGARNVFTKVKVFFAIAYYCCAYAGITDDAGY